MADCIEELLFFDTFAHDSTEEINLDLVQFPKPVYVTEVRIIPLGARVQADFPGGVRLGATNPSQFEIEFFVNDLGKPGASTFEALGAFAYDQNGKINLECAPDQAVRRIPTDGLVLKGLYTTITLAVYGTLTNSLAEQLVPPIVNPTLPSQPNTIADAQQIGATPEAEWAQDAPGEYQPPAFPGFHQAEPYQYPEYFGDVPKDPRSYHQEPEWEKGPRPRERYQEREHSERKGRYARSDSRERGKERHDR
ncbi:hypothetical protein HUJ05_011162 [Dendroctonus ponderosae]|nr:hypothetical protein HUJ05_011162 [Dendroctonus ponderosae]